MSNVAAKSFCRLRRSSKQTNQTWAGFLVALIQDLEGDELHLLVWMAMHRLKCMQCTHSCVLENQTKDCRVPVNRARSCSAFHGRHISTNSSTSWMRTPMHSLL